MTFAHSNALIAFPSCFFTYLKSNISFSICIRLRRPERSRRIRSVNRLSRHSFYATADGVGARGEKSPATRLARPHNLPIETFCRLPPDLIASTLTLSFFTDFLNQLQYSASQQAKTGSTTRQTLLCFSIKSSSSSFLWAY